MTAPAYEQEQHEITLPLQREADPLYVDRELYEYGVALQDIPRWKEGIRQLASAVAAERARIAKERTNESR